MIIAGSSTDAYLLSSPMVAFLVDIGFKGLTIVALAGLASLAFRKASSARRHLIWLTALCGLLLLPIVSAFGPHWTWVVPDPRPVHPESNKPAEPISAPPIQPGPESGRPAVTPGLEMPVVDSAVTHSAPALRAIDTNLWIVALWVTGGLITLLPMAIGRAMLARPRSTTRAPRESGWPVHLDAARATLNIRRDVVVLEHPECRVPMTWGMLRPRVLLPCSGRNWPPEKKRAVLLHELAHVHRHDYLTRIIGRVAVAIHWYNPLAWMALRRMRAESELACDNHVLRSEGHPEPADYADHLLGIARTMVTARWSSSSAITAVRNSRLERRLLAILDGSRDRSGATRRSLAIAALLFSAAFLPVATIRLVAVEQPAPSSDTETAESASIPMRHFCRLVISSDRMTFEGEDAEWEDLDALLSAVRSRANTVLELAADSREITIGEFDRAKSRAVALSRNHGFEYLSYIGIHPLGSKGSASQPRELTEPELERGRDEASEVGPQSPPLDLGVPAATDLQARIDAAEPGAVLEVPNGVYNQPLHIEKGLTLKGSDSAFCVLKVEADVPAIWITSQDPVRVERLTIKWQRATGRETKVTPAAVVIQDGDVEIRDCQFSATGDPVRSPCAVAAMGFSDVAIAESVFSEFDFTIQFWDGAKGRVEHCLVLNPGHCGVTVGRGSAVAVRRNIVAGSAYHGVRCTGGTVTVEDNLILHNRNRGIYLGNRTAHGTVRNNLILNNVTGIGVFADTDVAIENNVISGSEYAGIGTRDRSRIRVRNNVISANQRGIIVFEDLGTPRLDVGSNTFWGNETAAEDFELPSDTIETDPDFRNAADGDFSRPPLGEGSARHGLSSPSEIALLWPSWQAVSTHVIAED